MYSSVLSALCIGGFISLFYTFSVLCEDMGWLAPIAKLCGFFFQNSDMGAAFARGLVEMTGGCGAISQISSPLCAPLCTFLITFGGASILLQQRFYLKRSGVNMPVFYLVKFLQAVIASGICALVLSITA